MAKGYEDKTLCPLYNREIYFGECYEVQEVRDGMSPEYLNEPVSKETADGVCEKCKWYNME